MDQKIESSDEIREWLRTKTKSTAQAYNRRLNLFMRWYKSKFGEDVDIGHFLDRLDENQKLPRRERNKLAELVISDYIDYLVEEEKLAPHTIRNNFVALQNFLDYKGYSVSMRWIGKMPKAEGKEGNSKHRWTLEQIREFFGKADNYRDKAIILTMFQSGLAVNEICKLNYGHVSRELNKGELPLIIEMVRDKNSKRFRTCLGADAVKYLKLYLETRQNLTEESPLFTVERSRGSKDDRITKGAIQMRFREIAEGLSYIDLNDGEMNPARPHSMRSAFRSRLTGKMEEDLIEHLMGHTIPETKRAYINMPDEELRELYANFEHLLSIETTSKQVEAGLDRKTSEIEEKNLEKIEDLETTLRTQASQLAQLAELNSRLDGEVRKVKESEIMRLGEEALESLMEFVNLLKHPEMRERFLMFLKDLAQETSEDSQKHLET
jgi:integrase/recombinase XerD